MSTLRVFLLQHRWLAMWLVAAALVMKVVVPAGFMPTVSDGTIMVRLCTDVGVKIVPMAIPGLPGDADPQDQHGLSDQPCVFSGLSVPGLAGADATLLAMAIAFIFARALHPVLFCHVWRNIHLRPPAQGPPATI